MHNSLYYQIGGKVATSVLSILLLLLFSCTGKSTDNSLCLIETDGIIKIDETNLSNIINVKRLVPLEGGEKCMVGDITKLIKVDGMYFVESARNTLLVFDSLGHYLNKIGDVGGAENEYISISDFDVCEGRVYVLSPMRIQEYSIAGKYLRTIPTKYAAASALKVLEKKIVLYVLGDEKLIHVMDKEGKEETSDVESMEAMRVTSAITFHPFGDELLMPICYSNSLLAYHITRGEIRTMDMTDYYDAITPDILTEIEETGEKSKMDSYRIFDGFMMTQSQMLVAGKKGDEISLYTKDLASDKTHSYDFMKIEDDVTFGKGVTFFHGNTQAQDCFISFVEPPLMKERLDKSQDKGSELYQQWKRLVDEADDLSNPVLVEYTLK